MSCKERWIDVFVTKPDRDETSVDKQTYDYDEEFVCSVQSVRMDPRESKKGTAYVVDGQSDWIMPTWTADYGGLHPGMMRPGVANVAAFQALSVGDLIRVGRTNTLGFTEYLTILEKVEVTKLVNSTSFNSLPMSIDSENPQTLAASITDTVELPLHRGGIAHFAFRLNYSLGCTQLPSNVPMNSALHKQSNTGGSIKADNKATAETRDKAWTPSYDSQYEDEKYFYPLYRVRPWTDGTTLSRLYVCT